MVWGSLLHTSVWCLGLIQGRCLRRCVNQPQVCKQAAKALQHSGVLSLDEGSEVIEVYPSQASCCRPGLGAFVEGCKTDA